jgi:hypothetical protein
VSRKPEPGHGIWLAKAFAHEHLIRVRLYVSHTGKNFIFSLLLGTLSPSLFSQSHGLPIPTITLNTTGSILEDSGAKLNVADFKAQASQIRLVIDGRTLVAEKAKGGSVKSISGQDIWFGHVRGLDREADTAGTFDYRFRKNRFTGMIRVGSGIYSLEEGPQGIKLRDLSYVRQIPDHNSSSFQALQARSQLKPMASQDEATADSTATLRVLVAYTQDVTRVSGDSAKAIEDAIDAANLSYANSRIPLRLELAGMQAVPYSETGLSDDDVAALLNDRDGKIDRLHTLRDNYEADMVVLFVSSLDACGMATDIGSTKDTAFAIARWDCAAGNFTLAHEIGHLLSARHDEFADPTSSPYTFGHGYREPNSKWRTVMAYDCDAGCPRVGYWSSPDITYPGSTDRMGDSLSADNSRVLRIRGPVAARFADERCDEARKYLLNSGRISKQDYQFYTESGFAPIYNVARTPTSGIKSWAACSYVKSMGFL